MYIFLYIKKAIMLVLAIVILFAEICQEMYCYGKFYGFYECRCFL